MDLYCYVYLCEYNMYISVHMKVMCACTSYACLCLHVPHVCPVWICVYMCVLFCLGVSHAHLSVIYMSCVTHVYIPYVLHECLHPVSLCSMCVPCSVCISYCLTGSAQLSLPHWQWDSCRSWSVTMSQAGGVCKRECLVSKHRDCRECAVQTISKLGSGIRVTAE